MESDKLEVYLLILRTLEGGPYHNVAAALRAEMERNLDATRLDYLGQPHKTDLNNLLARYPNITTTTLERMCQHLKQLLDKNLPPSTNGINSYLSAGQFSLLRTHELLQKEDVEHSVKALISTRHYSPAYKNSSVNAYKHIMARKLRGPVCVRGSIPTEIHTRTVLYRKLMGHLSSVYCVCFDQTGQYVFTGADDHLIKVWSARDGRLLKTLRGHDGEITDMSVNYENRLLASGGMDRIIRIWELKTSKLIDCLNAHNATVTSVKFAPYNRHDNDRYLISTSNDGSVIFWTYNVDNPAPFKKLKKFQERNRPGGQIVCSSFSTGGSFLACGSSDNYIHIYGFHPDMGPYWINELHLHNDKVDSIQFSNQGFRFITGSQDGTAIICTFRGGRWIPLKLDMNTQLDQTVAHPANGQPPPRVLIVQWSRDDRYVMTSIVDYSIKIWDSHTGQLVHVLKEHKHDVYLLESHPIDPRIFISASHDGHMIIWDLERGKAIKKFQNRVDISETHETNGVASIYDIKFSPDGSMIAATDSYGYLSLFGTGTAEAYRDLPEQMFFHTDYRSLIRDVRQFVMDEQTHVAPHLMPKPTLVDMNGNPYPKALQRFVPDYKAGERIVVKPLSETQIDAIADIIERHSRQEDEEYLLEKRSPSDDLAQVSASSSMNSCEGRRVGNKQSNSSRYNTRFRISTRSSFQSARSNFQLPRARRTRSDVRYNENDDEDDQEPIGGNRRRSNRRRRQIQRPLPSDSSTEEDIAEQDDEEEDEEEEEADENYEDDDMTELESGDETVIDDSDATEIDEPQQAPTTRHITRQTTGQSTRQTTRPRARRSARLRKRFRAS